MRASTYGLVTLAIAAAVASAPPALADTCDPLATVCQGSEVQNATPSPDYSPSMTSNDQYPFDGDWYFDLAGGGTTLQPEHPGGGEGHIGAGGGHR